MLVFAVCVCVCVVRFLKSAQQPPTVQQQVFMSPILKGTKTQENMLETSNREDKIGEVGNGKIINWKERA